jgi:hypothetical protein
MSVLGLSKDSTKPSANKLHRVAPAELEGLLVGHEKVADACVLGIYDPDQATESREV